MGGAYSAGHAALRARAVSPGAVNAARRGLGMLGEIALSRETRAAIGQAAQFGGAAAESGVPVSSGGSYHPEWSRRVARAGEVLETVGQLVWTPAQVRERITEIDGRVGALDGQIRAAAANLGPRFVESWEGWRDAWRAFAVPYAGPDQSWYGRGWSGVVAEAARFDQGLGWWRGEARRLGGSGAMIGNEVEDRLRPLYAAWLSLKADIATARTAGTVSADFQSRFLEDWRAFDAFYHAHIGDWIVTHTTLGEIETRRQRLEQWRAAFLAGGGTSTAPPTLSPEPGVMARAAEIVGPEGFGLGARAVSGVAVAVVAVVALGAAIYFIPRTGGS